MPEGNSTPAFLTHKILAILYAINNISDPGHTDALGGNNSTMPPGHSSPERMVVSEGNSAGGDSIDWKAPISIVTLVLLALGAASFLFMCWRMMDCNRLCNPWARHTPMVDTISFFNQDTPNPMDRPGGDGNCAG